MSFKKSPIELFCVLIILFNISYLNAQEGNSAMTMIGAGNATAALNDYQSSGINPANLGWSYDNKKVHFGVGQAVFSIYSQPLKKSDIERFYKQDYSYLLQDKIDIVRNFTEAEVNIDGNFLLAGFSYQSPNWGGFSFTVQERGNWNFQLNQTASEFLFMGWNSDYFTEFVYDDQGNIIEGVRTTDLKTASELFAGSRFTNLWRRDYNFSYGIGLLHNENISLSIGAGVKYIKGYGIVNVRTDDQVSGYSSLSPLFDIDYPVPSPSSIAGNKHESVGSGWGYDFGLNIGLRDKLRIGIAITDLGSIKWDGNVYQANWEAKVQRIASPGINTNNIQDMIESIVISEDVYEWEGLDEIKVDLPARFRLGASYQLNPALGLGLDLVSPLNSEPGSLEDPCFSAGVLFNAAHWLTLSSGMKTGGNNAFNIPLGTTFGIGSSWEMGFGVRDVLTFFKQTNPTASLALGFIRIKAGTYKKFEMPDDNQDE